MVGKTLSLKYYGLLVGVTLAAGIAFIAATWSLVADTGQALANTAAESSSLEQLINNERSKHGLPALMPNDKLDLAACYKAQHMARNNYWGHVSPDGVTPWHWFKKAEYNYRHSGENLSRNFDTEEAMVKAWMESPKHRKNILGDFTEQGSCTRQNVTVALYGSR